MESCTCPCCDNRAVAAAVAGERDGLPALRRLGVLASHVRPRPLPCIGEAQNPAAGADFALGFFYRRNRILFTFYYFLLPNQRRRLLAECKK